MKKYIHLFVLAVIVAGMILCLPFFDSCEELTEDVLRVHILANSDSAADQSLKLGVRDRVLEGCSAYYNGCKGKEEALAITRDHLPEIERLAAAEIRRRGFDYPVRAEVGEMFFNTRYYDDFTLPAGSYDALRLTIGGGEGQNWWCVMYPSLCVGAASEREMKDSLDTGEYQVVTGERYDFRFKLVEYWEGIRACFRE
ncbi:stage II sporulation protein R [Ruminococcus sp.]|uniref:stage II sporulation protein R n=1 Tax=Ruminococcus sp. TaxID=41978 RepID=UPI00388E5E02